MTIEHASGAPRNAASERDDEADQNGRSAAGSESHIAPLTLRFAPDWEEAFRQDQAPGLAKEVRLLYGVGGAALLVIATLIEFVLQPATGTLAGEWSGPLLGATGLFCIGVAAVSVFPPLWRVLDLLQMAGVLVPAVAFGALALASRGQITGLDYLFSMILVFLFTFIFSGLRFVHAAPLGLLCYVAILPAVLLASSLPFKDIVRYSIEASVICLLVVVAGYVLERSVRQEYAEGRFLESERARAELLLLNILPASIADRLKGSAEPIADAFPEATILFADVVGFTDLCGRTPPHEVVGLLNDVFSDLDRLAAQHGLEKIKTIGDAYMVVGGLPVPKPDHAEAVADMALEIQRMMASKVGPTGDPLRLRIGINIGPVVAGVIGTTKFAYDLWGDTVNTASRMESHGVPGSIQVTQATYDRLRDQYTFEERGVIEVKGIGEMTVFLLTGRRTDFADGAVSPP